MSAISKARLMILEDDLQLANDYPYFLGAEQFLQVRTFTNTQQLYKAIFEREATDIFLLDIRLGPGEELGGLDAIRFIRPKFPKALIIVLTGFNINQVDCLSAGADYFFSKGGDSMHEVFENIKKVINDHFEKVGIVETNRLCLRVRNGVIEVLVEQSNGTIILHDGTQILENNLYVISGSNWSKIIGELQKLINKQDLKEEELQSFFEEYPDLILEDRYELPIPQAAIVTTDDVEWRADFVMVPVNQLSFAKILELKLPSQKISRKSITGHSRYSAKLFQAINQLKDYYEAFNSEKTQEKFRNKYKTDVFKPDLQLLFGRRETIHNSREFLELQRRNNVEIKDWDTLIEELKKKFK